MTEDIETCRDDDLFVELSRGPKGDNKYNFCFYCNSMQSKIARHLELQHGKEDDVKKFLPLPKMSAERRNVIGQIRKKGDFLPCSNCKRHYAINNLRHHYRICAKKKDTVRNILKLARSTAQSIYSRASLKL